MTDSKVTTDSGLFMHLLVERKIVELEDFGFQSLTMVNCLELFIFIYIPDAVSGCLELDLKTS